MGVEANSRQFFPAANEAVGKVHPGLCEIRDGYARTASMTAPTARAYFRPASESSAR